MIKLLTLSPDSAASTPQHQPKRASWVQNFPEYSNQINWSKYPNLHIAKVCFYCKSTLFHCMALYSALLYFEAHSTATSRFVRLLFKVEHISLSVRALNGASGAGNSSASMMNDVVR